MAYKFEIKLSQYTPLIHFQPNQVGASIRASELKPKFDRFLKTKISNSSKLYLKGQKAFDYKVVIEPIYKEPKDIRKFHPLFFANLNSENPKKFVKTNNLKITFYSFKPQMIEEIKKHFKAFIANTNFGSRNSKGFGSFYIRGEDFDKSLIEAKRVYSFSTNNWEDDVALFYKFLRSGINDGIFNKSERRFITKFYVKPLIFLYAKSKGWEWDKRAIKRRFFNRQLQEQIQAHRNADVLTYTSNNKYLVRDMLGLSTFQYWKSYNAKLKKESRKRDGDDPYYERMRSPITFKVVKNRVYFWVDNFYKRILNEDFIIKVVGRNNSLTLPTPPEFDIDEMLMMLRDINLANIVEKRYQNHKNFSNLNRIINEIRAKL